MKKNQPQKPLNKAILLSGAGLQMGITIYLFVHLGKWLDVNYNNSDKGYIVLTTLIGVSVSLYVLVKQLNHINKE